MAQHTDISMLVEQIKGKKIDKSDKKFFQCLWNKNSIKNLSFFDCLSYAIRENYLL